MSLASMARGPVASLLLPGILLAGLLGLIVFETEQMRLPIAGGAVAEPQTVTIAPRRYTYRAGGEFQRDGVTVDGSLLEVAAPPPLDIMVFEVSVAEYAACVADDACEPAEPRRRGTGDVPVTGVSFDDAVHYAAWLSRRTGVSWRLPTIAEWHFAAGSRARDDALDIATDAANPSARWLALYRQQAARGTIRPAKPEPLGSGGRNEFGVADLSGAVWEWTSTCGGRTSLGPTGDAISQLQSCGVRYLEGRHRTPMSAFIRDAQSGGCSTGSPPDNLGFRLVRDPDWLATMLGWIRV